MTVEVVNGWDEDHQHLVREEPEETEFRWRIIGEGEFSDVKCDCGAAGCWGHWLPKGSTADEAQAAGDAALAALPG